MVSLQAFYHASQKEAERPAGSLSVAADSQRAHIRRQHALPIMGWTTSAMPHRYTSWMENERDQALEAFRGLRP